MKDIKAEEVGLLLSPLLTWYRAESGNRGLPWRGQKDPYKIWLSEIMLQQTRASVVVGYYERFLDALPTVRALSAVEDDTLMKLWQGLGYYSRAKNLKRAATVIVRDYGGVFPRELDALLALPGIGPYTGRAIGSIAYDLPLPAVDGNVVRVLTRALALADDAREPALRTAMESALSSHYRAETAGGLNQAFMDLGATICLPHGAPHCESCPIARLCLAHAEGAERDFPKKSPKKPRKIEKLTILRMHRGGRIAIKKRPAKGLLAGLFELPNLPGHLNKEELSAYCKGKSIDTISITPLPPCKHIFTHREWQMIGYDVRLKADDTRFHEGEDSILWVTRKDLAEHYSIPSAFLHYLREE